jgi:tRNA nucleotidyltransferase/poly(A) polymerase
LERLRSSVKHQKKSVLSKTINFFVRSKFHAYLVGGYVRDTTLGLEPLDIDIVVEGNAIKAAQQLNAKLKGELVTYNEFGTASINTKQTRVDLASARVEQYMSPAKLPHVYPSTINEDLNRRDFRINAIAMSISNENFGEIFDPFQGLDDIKKGMIRVLHKNSFIDDPTRIFRALRYKNRFGFKLGKKTKSLMIEAINKKMIQRLSGQRILDEIKLIFSEDKYCQIVKDLSDLTDMKIRKKDLDLLSAFGHNQVYYYLAKIKSNKLPLSRHEKDLVKHFKNLSNTITRLDKATKKSTIYNMLSPIPEPVVDEITAVHPRLKEKITLFRKLKRVKPFISGADLKKRHIKPERKFKSILKKIHDHQLDKKISSRQEALKFLKKITN